MASNLLALYCVVALLDRKERCDVYMSNCSSCWFCGVRHIFKSFNSGYESWSQVHAFREDCLVSSVILWKRDMLTYFVLYKKNIDYDVKESIF
ncbi:hypothetical protein MtrunA17_Chr0c01g0489411 [Medicago truncatula]|uniref:Uncharacterized protein n=1 Tax=Medicago truncatula TaxID=3880 RepID=A0A396G9P2_MEDTR|nr:hypothetical protein MtrunA17_Chr0c01g0489411 [Medicago truncatula]